MLINYDITCSKHISWFEICFFLRIKQFYLQKRLE
mgnify:CR=1 FL=1